MNRLVYDKKRRTLVSVNKAGTVWDWRGWLSRKLLRLATRIDPEQRFVYQAGEFKFERHWQQPVSTADTTNT